jgi:hypothetical protein
MKLPPVFASGSFEARSDGGKRLRISGGVLFMGELTSPITGIRRVTQQKVQPGIGRRATRGMMGGMAGLLFSPVGAAIGAVAGALTASGTLTHVLEIQTEAGTPVLIVIPDEQAATLEAAAQKQIE